MADLEDVAKVRIVVRRDGERWCLMSRKRSNDKKKHNKLEFLGGHLQAGDSPADALVRELGEEEKTGTLVRLVEAAAPRPASLDVKGMPHFLFEIEISEAETAQVEPDPRESCGFELVLEHDLEAGTLQQQLTPRTRQILKALLTERSKGARR